MKMRLAPVPPTGMATMFFAIIADLQMLWVEGAHKSLFNFLRDSHIFLCQPLQPGCEYPRVRSPSRKGVLDDKPLSIRF